MTEGISVVQATAPKYLKGFVDQTVRNRIWLSMLRRYGRIKTGESGTSLTWDVQFSEPPVRQYGDAGDLTFADHDAYRQLTLDWRGYRATDRLTEKKYLMNDDPVAIVMLYDQKIENLKTSIRNTFGHELYVDGNATGNDNRLHGLKSFMGDDGATVAGDLVARPSDSYAGQSTVLATLGGSWSSDGTAPNATIATDWPNGSGDTEYTWMSPILLNYSSTSWGTGATTWESNCERVLRRAVNWCKHLGGAEAGPYMHMLAVELFTGFQDFQAARNRISVPHKEAEDLGFPDALNHDGTVVKSDYDCPTGEGFGLIPGEMKLCGLGKGPLFRPRGPDWDPKTASYLFQIGMFGNLLFNPPRFSRYKAYA